MNKPLVSIQLPTFNQATFIHEAVESALKQSHRPLEIIVADDGSPYNISDLLSDLTHSAEVKIVVNQPNKGRVKNYHDTLYNEVRGKYFTNLDGDDYYIDKDFISYGVSILEKHTKDDVVMYEAGHDLNHCQTVLQNFQELDEHSILVNGIHYFEKLEQIGKFSHASCIFKTDVARSIDFYAIDALSTDWNSATRMLFKGNIILSNKKVAHWRVHESNASWSLKKDTYQNETQSIQSIIATARPHVNPQKLKEIERSMMQGLYQKTLSQLSTQNLTGLAFALKHFSFKKAYLRSVLSYLRRALKS